MKKDHWSFFLSVFLGLFICFVPFVNVHADDHGDDFASATSVSIGSVTSGVIDNTSDQDFFTFTVSQQAIYVFSSRGIASGNNLLFTLYNSQYQQTWSSTSGGVGGNFRMETQLSPGTYYVGVQDYINHFGPYELQIEGPGATTPIRDDHGDHWYSATPVSVGTVTGGTIDQVNDQDFFRFTVSQQAIYIFSSRGIASGNNLLFTLYNSQYQQTWSSTSGGVGGNFRMETQLSPGTYYVGVQDYINHFGPYELQIEGPGATTPIRDDHGDHWYSATPVSVGTVTGGTIEEINDQDFFRFTVSQQAIYIFSSRGIASGNNLLFTLYNSQYQQTWSSTSGSVGGNFRMETQLSPGTYYIGVQDFINHFGPYELQIEGPGATTPIRDDHGDHWYSATQVSVGTVTGGTIEEINDQDFFRFTVSQQAIYIFSSRGIASGNNLLFTLYNSQYQQMWTSTSGGVGGNFRMDTQLSPGTYYVGVQDFINHFGPYELQIEGPGATTPIRDDRGDHWYSATPVSVGTVTGGTIEEINDQDFFRFTVSRTEDYVLWSSGIASGNNLLFTLYNSQYQQMWTSTSGGVGGNFRMETQLSPGTYYVGVQDFINHFGPYQLHIDRLTSPTVVFGTNTQSGYAADPVNTSTGNYTFQRTDLSIPGKGFPFVFSRTYNSQDSTSGPLGYGWTHSYASTLAVNPDTTVTIRSGDGKTDTWTPDGLGGYTLPYGVFDNLVSLGGGSYSLTKKDRTVHQFNSSGRLASITDKNGNALTLFHSGSSLTQVTDTAGRNILFTLDGSNRITRITDPSGRIVEFSYDGSGNLVTSTDLNGNVTTFTYDGNHQMLTATDPRANVFVTNVYDADRRVVTSQRDAKGGQTTYYYDTVNKWTAITNPLGQTSYHFYDDLLRLTQDQNPLGHSVSYTYDFAGNRSEVMDRNGNVTQYGYDVRGNVTSKTDALNAVTTITYDGNNNPLSRTDPIGATTYFAYDTVGNLTHQTDPLGKVTAFTYGTWGELLTTTDANGHPTVFAYDVWGNLDNTTDALGNLTKYTYDDVGRRLTKTDARGHTSTFTYDNNSNLLSTMDGLGNVTSSTYDNNSNRLTATDARGYTTHFAYDVKDLLTTVTDPLSHAASIGYDPLDRKITATDKRGATSYFDYDAAGRLIQVTDPGGGISTFTYDNNANRLTETDPLGNTAGYAYDALNRVVSRTDPLGNIETTAYDAVGRVVSKTNAKGQTTQFEYDPLGRLIGVLDPNGGIVEYFYDNVGNRISVTDPNGRTTTYAYDALNRLIQMIEPLGSTTTYSYDAVGNLITLTDPNGKTTTYAYDGNNRLTQVTYWDTTSVRFIYDENGNRLQMQDGIGISTYAYDALNRMISASDGFSKSLGYAYDENGNLTTLTYPGSQQVQYTYDAMNRMVTVTDWQARTTTYSYDAASRLIGAVNPNGTTAAYGYDSASRLTGLANRKSDTTVISSYAYTLDPLGNHLQVTQTEPLSPPLPLPKNLGYTYDTENRLITAGAIAFTYDYNGNMLTKGSDTFAYDPADQLSSSTIAGVSSTYRYDGMGNRVERTEDGVTRRYVVDGNRSLPSVIMEMDGSGNATSYYVYGLGLISRVLPDGTASFYHYDSRGSTVGLTDASQTVTDAYSYDPFGQVIAQTGTSSQDYRFVGNSGLQDDGNGLIYVRARYYLPIYGRFTKKDNLINESGTQELHRYVYAINNSVIIVDEDGNVINFAAAGIGAAVGAVAGGGAAALNIGLREGFSWGNMRDNLEEIAGGALGGAVTGGVAGLTMGGSLVVHGVAASAALGSASGAIGSALGNISTQGLRMWRNKQENFDVGDLMMDTGIGIFTGAAFGAISGSLPIPKGSGGYAKTLNTMFVAGKKTPYYIGKTLLIANSGIYSKIIKENIKRIITGSGNYFDSSYSPMIPAYSMGYKK